MQLLQGPSSLATRERNSCLNRSRMLPRSLSPAPTSPKTSAPSVWWWQDPDPPAPVPRELVFYHGSYGGLDDGHGIATVGSQEVGQYGVSLAAAGTAVADDGNDHDQNRIRHLNFPLVLGVHHQFCATGWAVPLYLGEVEPEMLKIILY